MRAYDIILFLITLASSIYAVFCHYRAEIFKDGFTRLAKITFNPKTREDCIRIVEKLRNDSIGIKDTDNK